VLSGLTFQTMPEVALLSCFTSFLVCELLSVSPESYASWALCERALTLRP
jgi:hypothetical protein